MIKNISVIVPAFNEELLIKKTIDSVPDDVDKNYYHQRRFN